MIAIFNSGSVIKYTGKELSPHWIFKTFNISGSALVAFMGACKVDIGSMVDLEDVRDKAPIYSPNMLHFIGEFFDDDLLRTVYRQRLLVVTVKEQLEKMKIALPIVREGDDLYVNAPKGRGKLSVSIATRSVVSTLIHMGVNIETTGTPVKTAGLSELGIDPTVFAGSVLMAFQEEEAGIMLARSKVRSV